MTCAVAYRPSRRPDRRNLNSDFTLLAVDGRITDDHGTIHADRAIKWSQAGHIVSVWAGDAPAMQNAMQRLLEAFQAKPESVGTVRLAAKMLTADTVTVSAGDWSALMYDSRAHELYTVDSDGGVFVETQRVAAIGSGADVALGYLQACDERTRAWTEKQAKLNLRNAIRNAAKRHATVGSRATVLTVRRDGRVQVRG